MFDAITSIESGATLTGLPIGAILHGNIGTFVVPLLALAWVVIALLSHAGLKGALYTLRAVMIQIGLAIAACSASWVGVPHAVIAFGIVALAELAAHAVVHVEVKIPTRNPVSRPARKPHVAFPIHGRWPARRGSPRRGWPRSWPRQTIQAQRAAAPP